MNQIPDRIVRPKEALTILGISRASLFRFKKTDPAFPQAIQLGERAVGWRLSALQDWLNSRLQAK